MKIIREGTKPGPPWWVGVKLTCACGCEVELEEADRVHRYFPEGAYRKNSDLAIQCPSCKKDIVFPNRVQAQQRSISMLYCPIHGWNTIGIDRPECPGCEVGR